MRGSSDDNKAFLHLPVLCVGHLLALAAGGCVLSRRLLPGAGIRERHRAGQRGARRPKSLQSIVGAERAGHGPLSIGSRRGNEPGLSRGETSIPQRDPCSSETSHARRLSLGGEQVATSSHGHCSDASQGDKLVLTQQPAETFWAGHSNLGIR